MPKVTISSASGLVQETGTGFTLGTGNEPVHVVRDLTSSTTLTTGGVFTISGSTALTITLPASTSVPGSRFIFRNGSTHAHKITGSASDAGTYKYFCDETQDDVGQQLTFPATRHTSVAFVCDGKNFMLYAQSGSIALATP